VCLRGIWTEDGFTICLFKEWSGVGGGSEIPLEQMHTGGPA